MENRVEELITLCESVSPKEINEIVSNCINRCERAEHRLRHTLHSKQVSQVLKLLKLQRPTM